MHRCQPAIGSGRDPSQFPELAHQVRLVGVAAICRQLRPSDRAATRRKPLQQLPEAQHAGIGFRGQTDLGTKTGTDVPMTESAAGDDIADAHALLHLTKRTGQPWRHRRRRLSYPRKKLCLEQRQPRRQILTLQQALAQVLRRTSPQSIEIDMTVSQFVRGHAKQGLRRSGAQHRTNRIGDRIEPPAIESAAGTTNHGMTEARSFHLTIEQAQRRRHQTDHQVHRPGRQHMLGRRPRGKLVALRPQALDPGLQLSHRRPGQPRHPLFLGVAESG